MTHKMMYNTNLMNTFYSNDGRKQAVVNATPTFIFVEFYFDEVIVGGVEVVDHNTHYAFSIAENYCNGILNIEPWETNEILKHNLHESDSK